jgi:hypothetical protein
MRPNNFEIHQHGARYWYAIHDPESWELLIASPAVHETPAEAATAAVGECRNLARVAARRDINLQGVSAL